MATLAININLYLPNCAVHPVPPGQNSASPVYSLLHASLIGTHGRGFCDSLLIAGSGARRCVTGTAFHFFTAGLARIARQRRTFGCGRTTFLGNLRFKGFVSEFGLIQRQLAGGFHVSMWQRLGDACGLHGFSRLGLFTLAASISLQHASAGRRPASLAAKRHVSVVITLYLRLG